MARTTQARTKTEQVHLSPEVFENTAEQAPLGRVCIALADTNEKLHAIIDHLGEKLGPVRASVEPDDRPDRDIYSFNGASEVVRHLELQVTLVAEGINKLSRIIDDLEV